MGIAEILGVAGSFSLLAGWRLYLTLLVTGVAMHFGWLPLPEHLQSLEILANPWVMGAAAVGTAAEFLADKIAWFDSFWDGVHSFIRPLGGALITLAIVDASDPIWQIISIILGGGGALISHSAKASTRAAVNISPEPYTNAAVSASEDVATTGLLALVVAFPALGIFIALLLLAACVAVIYMLNKLRKKLKAAFGAARSGDPAAPHNPPTMDI